MVYFYISSAGVNCSSEPDIGHFIHLEDNIQHRLQESQEEDLFFNCINVLDHNTFAGFVAVGVTLMNLDKCYTAYGTPVAYSPNNGLHFVPKLM